MRVTDMRDVDLNLWRFDWDLTFAALIVHPDGTILSSYGGRDKRGPDHWLTEPSYEAFLGAGVTGHRARAAALAASPDAPAKPTPPLPINSIPAFAERDRGECIHCHSALPALRVQAQREDRWDRDSLWAYPPPSKIGVDLDRDDQALITAVAANSPAAQAGLKVGDRLADQATATDLMTWLDGLPAAPSKQTLSIERDGKLTTIELDLAPGWKTYDSDEFAWRPSKWGLSPAPGFGGPVLGPAALDNQGLEEGTFAFRVNYLVTWGENQRWGQAAAKAGIRDGMIVLGTATKRDFSSIDHFHAWWRLEVEHGSTVDVVTWKDGEEYVVRLQVL